MAHQTTTIGDNGIEHSSLVEIGEKVRAAGHMLVKNGVVSANLRSGHFMQDRPIRGDELIAWKNAMSEAIKEAGMRAGEISDAGILR
jgi:hypothetical protein